MRLLPTAKLYNLVVNDQVDERYDPIKSTEAACQYLNDSYRIFKNWTLVAASYNMGAGGLRKQMEKQRVDNYYDLYLNRETAAYIFRILAVKAILEHPDQYGFSLKKEQLYSPLRYNLVEVDTTINDLVGFAIQQNTTYKLLKVLNPWILGDKLEVPKAKEGQDRTVYRIAIPKDASNGDIGQELVPFNRADSLVSDSLPISPKSINGATPNHVSDDESDEADEDAADTKVNNKSKRKSGGN
jgi:membrane-bound lytic murein transglycosylase D